VLANYLRDEATDGWAVLIVWQNPEWRASAAARGPQALS